MFTQQDGQVTVKSDRIDMSSKTSHPPLLLKLSPKPEKKKQKKTKDESNMEKYFKQSPELFALDSENVPPSNSKSSINANSLKNPIKKSSTKAVKLKNSKKLQSKNLRKNYSQLPMHTVKPKELKKLSKDEESNSYETSTKNESQSSSIFSLVATQDRCKLSSWGLPPLILRKYELRGLTTMFPWQVECLSSPNLLEKNRNLVYSAPTSAGKTLVAEIIVIKTVTERRKKVIFILPFVSVVREKMYYFQDLLTDSGLRVEGFMGGCSPPGGFAATDVAIATIEKANSLLNQLMEEGTLSNLGAVVIDELHLLGDSYRGYLLELLLTKLKYMTLQNVNINVQLIGMSATLPNLSLLAKWLDAELYSTNFRPVPLKELCKIGTTIYDSSMKIFRSLSRVPELSSDSDNILQLCLETIGDGHSVLIFCPTKHWCETLAQQVAGMFFKLGQQDTAIGRSLREELSSEAIMETLEQLKRSPAGLDDVLRSTVSFGVAFHHAGLTMDERDVIEGAFRSGALRVLTATSTLSSGVNLPARRVIIRSLMFHGKPLDTLSYRQMIGRAGRMGKDTAGESILICKSNETKSATTLLSANLQPIVSCLEGSGPLIRALLEAVASEVAYTAKDIELYTNCTLVSFANEDFILESTRQAIKFLVDHELFMLQTTENGEERWIATLLGKACLAASIPPSDGLFLFEELQKARRCFVLDTELHVIYLVTPFSSSQQIGQIDWIVFLDLWQTISESERRVGHMVGVEEGFLMSAVRGGVKPGKILDVHKRFYTALALHELVREVSLADVCKKYRCCRGVVQGLQQSAAAFAGMVTQFCKKLGWTCMELLIGQFQARLQFGVCRELLDLLRLPMLNGLRARSLFKEGITCVAELAKASELDVERALHKALPFESEKEQMGEHVVEAKKRNKVRSIFVTGRDGLTPRDAAVILVREARTLVQNELGIDGMEWKERKMVTKNCSQISNKNETEILEHGKSSGIPESSVDRETFSSENNETAEEEKRKKSDLDATTLVATCGIGTFAVTKNVEDVFADLTESFTIVNEKLAPKDNSKNLEQTENCSRKLTKSQGHPEQSKIRESCLFDTSTLEIGKSEIYDDFEFTSSAFTIEKEKSPRSLKEKQIDEDSTRINEPGKARKKLTSKITESSQNREESCKFDTFNSVKTEEGTFEFTGSGFTMEKSDSEISKRQSNSRVPEIRELAKTSRELTHKLIECYPNSGNSEIRSIMIEESCKFDTFFPAETVEEIFGELEFTGSGFTNEKSGSNILGKQSNSKVKENEKIRAIAKTVGESRSKSTERQAHPDNSKVESQISKASCKFDTFSHGRTAERMFEDFEFTDTGFTMEQDKLSRRSKHKQNHADKKIREFAKPDGELRSKSTESQLVHCDQSKIEGTFDDFELNGTVFTSEKEKLSRTSHRGSGISTVSEARSPSLFGDSLNIDTQECNILEQNVMDSLNISDFEETNFSGALGCQKTETSGNLNRRSSAETHKSSVDQTRRSPRIASLKNRSESLAWDDDSGNNTNGVIDAVNQLSTVALLQLKTVKLADRENFTLTKSRVAELKKIPLKRKLSEPDLEKSPIARIVTYAASRRLSIDSNKSDSDDVITPSQRTQSSVNSVKNRTRLKLENLARKSKTKRTKLITSRGKENCSIESIASISDDESPVKRTNVTKKYEAGKKNPALSFVRTTVNRSELLNKMSINLEGMQISNVTSNLTKFNQFKRELVGRKDIALSLACEHSLANTVRIGAKIIGVTGVDGKKKSRKIDNCVYGNKKLSGIAITWDGIVVHYVSFENTQGKDNKSERWNLFNFSIS